MGEGNVISRWHNPTRATGQNHLIRGTHCCGNYRPLESHGLDYHLTLRLMERRMDDHISSRNHVVDIRTGVL